jgi:enoyl-CoA hydratase/carnithine racemase
LSTSDDDLPAAESRFYAQARKDAPGTKPAEYRRRWERLLAAREVYHTLKSLRAAGARVDYHALNIADQDAVKHALAEVKRLHGDIDLIIHGAGIQVSRLLLAKPLDEFRHIVATKLDGLEGLVRAAREVNTKAPNVHILTSAFSYFGNDGQPDYGAANECMNAIAAWNDSETSSWSSLAWLGWAGIGMTRGSEYAVLSQSRGLRPVTELEGQAIFLRTLRGRPASPISILMGDGELQFSGTRMRKVDDAVPLDLPSPLADSPGADKTAPPTLTLTTATHPYLADHVVASTPTLPGTFEVGFAVMAALGQNPGWKLAEVKNTTFRRFVRVGRRGMTLRARCTTREQSATEVVVLVELLSDIIHPSGRVLETDILHMDATVRLVRTPPMLRPQLKLGKVEGATASADPYTLSGSPVSLQGAFKCLHEIEIGTSRRAASYRIPDATDVSPFSAYPLPVILLDAICRLAMIELPVDGKASVFVPDGAGCMRAIDAAGTEAEVRKLGPLTLVGTIPSRAGDLVVHPLLQAVDRSGRVVLEVENLRARAVGSVSVPEELVQRRSGRPAAPIVLPVKRARDFGRELGRLSLETIALEWEASLKLLWCWQTPKATRQTRAIPRVTEAYIQDVRTLIAWGVDFFKDLGAAEPPVNLVVHGSRVPGMYNLGGDLNALIPLMRRHDRAALERFAIAAADLIYQTSAGFGGLPVATAALVAGQALGGGFESALSMDFIFAEKSARLGLPEAMYNMIAGMGAYNYLARRTSHQVAAHLMLTGQSLSAEKLYASGVVDHLVADGEGVRAVRRFAAQMLDRRQTLVGTVLIRRRTFLPSRDELIESGKLWAELASSMSERDLQRVEQSLALLESQAAEVPVVGVEAE